MEAAGIHERPQPGQVLLDWLRLLDWEVCISGGKRVEGTAHRTGSTEQTTVHVEGGSVAEVAWQLFERAVLVDEDRPRRQAA